MGTSVIKREITPKLLGIYLDSQLNWKHINHIQSKAKKQCGLMYHSKQAQNKHAMKQLYASLMYLHKAVWGVTHKSSLKHACSTKTKNNFRSKKFDQTREGFVDLLRSSEMNVYFRCLVLEKIRGIS